MNLVLSRHGIWYSRFTYLLPSGKRKEIRKSLRTRCKRTANQLMNGIRLASVMPSGEPCITSDAMPPISPCGSSNDSQALMLSEAIEIWLAERTRVGLSSRELRRVSAYMTLLVSVVGDKRVYDVKRGDANRFKDNLLTSDRSITTINNYIKRAKALYTWLATRLDNIKNPFEGLLVRQTKAPNEQRPIFTQDDLRRLQRHTQTLPTHKRWIIEIALYTGMRQNEICQLYKEDIQRVDGAWCINVTDTRPDQRLKSSNSRRVIPIATDLLDKGILTLADSCNGGARLFPELSDSDQGYARHFTKWYSRWRKRNALPEFHSIRHTVATKLKSQGVPEHYTAQLLGHVGGGMTYGRYGKQVDVKCLVPLVNALNGMFLGGESAGK